MVALRCPSLLRLPGKGGHLGSVWKSQPISYHGQWFSEGRFLLNLQGDWLRQIGWTGRVGQRRR